MKSLLVMVMALLVLASCKKSDSGASGRVGLLTQSEWRFDNGTASSGGFSFDITTLGIIPPCALDNSAQFNANGTGISKENTLVCQGSSPTSNFNWAFLNNETQLSISGNALLGIQGVFNVRELTASRLSLGKDTVISGAAVNVVINLKH
jgi:hypothetical protein